MSQLNLSATLELMDKISEPLKKIMLPLQKTQEAFAKAEGALRGFERQAGMIGKFRQMSSAYDELAQKTELARKKMILAQKI